MKQVTLKEYAIGFSLSVVLTLTAFALTMAKIFNKETTIFIILFLAVVQIFVHMICFLHVNTKSEKGWTAMSLVFTAILLVIMLSGSIWVMYHLNSNMMPGMTDMKNMPSESM